MGTNDRQLHRFCYRVEFSETASSSAICFNISAPILKSFLTTQNPSGVIELFVLNTPALLISTSRYSCLFLILLTSLLLQKSQTMQLNNCWCCLHLVLQPIGFQQRLTFHYYVHVLTNYDNQMLTISQSLTQCRRLHP
jgi:hypothetical protein